MKCKVSGRGKNTANRCVLIALLAVLCYIISVWVSEDNRMNSDDEEILNEIRRHMAEKNYSAAAKLLEAELAVPFIPKDVEPILIQLNEECRRELRQNTVQRYDEADIERLLMGNLDEQLMAVELLKNSNLHRHYDIIEAYLNQNPHELVRALLIDALREQNIADAMHTTIDGLEVTFLPCYIEPVMQADGARIAESALREWFENEDPSFLAMCLECLRQECYLHLPFNIAADEGLPLAKSIVYAIQCALGKAAEFTAFCDAHRLPHECEFTLLFNKHGI